MSGIESAEEMTADQIEAMAGELKSVWVQGDHKCFGNTTKIFPDSPNMY
jgi:hypothetical protein